MSFDARVVLVLIASPGDTADERDAVERALQSFNSSRAELDGVALLPLRWERDAVPVLGGRGQAQINSQLVDRSDIVIGIFDSRLGTATLEAVSGTAEEIFRAHQAGKPVHVWFSTEPLPRDTDPEQLAALNNLRRDLEAVGLLGKYASPDDLLFRVRNAVEHDLQALAPPTASRAELPRTAAVLRARYAEDREPTPDWKGNTYMRTTKPRIVVRNIGSQAAEGVSIELIPHGDAPAPDVREQDVHPDLIPDSDFAWLVLESSGTAMSYDVIMRWHEGEESRSERQAVSEV